MNATLEPSPSPNQTRNIGRKARGGIGRTNSMIGSTISRTGTHIAASRPRASAATAARPKPTATRARDVATCRGRLPSRTVSAKTVATSPGVGRSAGAITPSIRLPYETAAHTTSTPTSARIRVRLTRAPGDFFLHHARDLALVVGELGRETIAHLRQLD